jgi:UDP-N-acetyl-2-amino-2-deoxyglucuronate dehydrogenase
MGAELAVGLAGCGHIAARHAAALAALRGRLRLDGVFDLLAARGRDFAARHGGTAVRSFAALLARDPDVVCICTPNPTHAGLALAALRAGHHVVLEHPLALNEPDALRICRAAEAAGRRAFVVRQRRYLPSVQMARRLLARRALGTIREVAASVLWSRPPGYYAASAWRRSAESGGVAINQGSHFLDLLLYLFGDPVASRGWRGNLRHPLPCEDTCAGTIEFADGVTVEVFLTVACRDGFQGGALDVRGDAGRLALGGAHWESVDAVAEMPAPEPGQGDHQELWRRVAEALASREIEVVDTREGARAVRLIDEIRSRWPLDSPACLERLRRSACRFPSGTSFPVEFNVEIERRWWSPLAIDPEEQLFPCRSGGTGNTHD